MLRRDTDEEGDEFFITLTATLMSKKDWRDAAEETHVVNLTRVAFSYYDETKQQLYWMWEFQPCHAGEYYLRHITLRVAATTLVYTHNKASMTLSGGRFSGLPSVRDVASGVDATPQRLLSVPEPDIGIRLHVEPPDEAHCFGDSPSFFSVRIDAERPLFPPHGTTTTTPAVEAAATDFIGFRNCFFEAPLVPELFAGATPPVNVVPGPRDDLQASTPELTPAPDPRALATIHVCCPKSHAMSRAAALHFATSVAPSKGTRETLVPQGAAMGRQSDFGVLTETPLGGAPENPPTFLVPIVDEKTGTFTTVPVDEPFVMSHLPSLACTNSGKKTVGDDVRKEVRSMYLEGSILTTPKQRCRFRICLDGEAQGLADESCGGLLEGTRLECALPLLPMFMSSSEECALVSLSCRRNLESCTTSVSVPLCFAPAFEVRYAFKCFQSHVYCLVQVENVLTRTSLWLRGALLEFLDARCPYKLARLSSVHERLMLREWKPRETVHMLFELTPSDEPCTCEKEMRHRVRLQLLYSDWSITTRMGPLESHVLRQSSQPSMYLSSSALPTAALSAATTTTVSLTTTSPVGSGTHDSEEAGHHNRLSGSLSSSATGRFFSSSPSAAKTTQIIYDSAQLERLRATCNTFYGPVGTFTSRHLCLFNVIIFVDPLHPTNHGVRPFRTASGTAEAPRPARGGMTCRSRDACDDGTFPANVSPVNLPGDSVFSVGEPICFSVTLEPLAHNWPEDSACEEEFWITFRADPAAWLVTGKQRLRRALSMMEDETLHFTAVPVASVSCVERNTCRSFQPQGQRQEADQDGKEQKLSVVATPTIEIHWASHDDVNGGDVLAKDDAVAIEVVQFRTSIRIQHG